jgi:2-haloacid dehalogenase
MTLPKALLFDVFGTVVDWRGSIERGVRAFFEERDAQVDAARFALDWRALYQPAMAAVREGRRDWVVLDVLHRENLVTLLERDGLQLTEAEIDGLNGLWHRLSPWPDSAGGLASLHRRTVTAPLSNGNIALMVNLARHGGLTWDTVLGAEIARAYKPDPAVYLRAAEALGLAPGDCMMVAAHNDDLRAARALGLRCAFVARPLEYGAQQTRDLEAEEDWEVVTDSLTGLARALE